MDDCDTAFYAHATRSVEPSLRPDNGLLALSERPAGLDAWQLAVEDNGIVMRGSGDPRDNGLMIARLLALRLDGRLESPGVTAGTRCLVTVPCLTARA